MNLIHRIKYGKIIREDFFQENKDFYLNEFRVLTNASAKICFWWAGDLPCSKYRKYTNVAQEVSGEELIQILKLTKEFEESPWKVVLRKKNNQKYYWFKYSIGKDLNLGAFNSKLKIIGENKEESYL